jgi:hypothetical protein
MPDEPTTTPSLPSYLSTHHFPSAKQQGIFNKVLGKMLVKKLPKLGRKGKISSDRIKIGRKKVKYW